MGHQLIFLGLSVHSRLFLRCALKKTVLQNWFSNTEKARRKTGTFNIKILVSLFSQNSLLIILFFSTHKKNYSSKNCSTNQLWVGIWGWTISSLPLSSLIIWGWLLMHVNSIISPCLKSQEVGRKIAGTYTVHFWHLGGIQNLGWYLKSRSTEPF